ncbi:hypothetical protein LQW54_003101 [Pestalotiopsis sp. IQ-011]
MWLINVHDLKLENFVPPHLPPYAILSHTWEDDEVTFQDFANLRVAKRRRGYAKIKKTCDLAAAAEINYAWVDTCCIDKSSSAELSEAINSMFEWYRQSSVFRAASGQEKEYAVTNKGIRIDAELLPAEVGGNRRNLLRCTLFPDNNVVNIVIRHYRDNIYVRELPATITPSDSTEIERKVNLRRKGYG